MSVLSIQSHVAFGHAGNSAAVFPLQRLGREVWAVNTVEFSNHTGYGAWRGEVLDADMIDEIVLGLEERKVLAGCEAVLSGYLGGASSGRAILNAVRRVRAVSPEALYCCDPVMGDIGRGFYVHSGIPQIFRDEVIPLADIVTPNQFELEALTGKTAASLDSALDAIQALHVMGPSVVLVTSYREGIGTGALGEEAPETSASGPAEQSAGPELEMIVSSGKKRFRIRTPELFFAESAMMAGSGDLTAAVFLSRYLETRDIRAALELTAGSVYGIMEATHRAGSRELLLIAAQDEFVRPSRAFTAEELRGA